jgi:hypothetical protein
MIVDVQSASPSYWKTACMALRMCRSAYRAAWNCGRRVTSAVEQNKKEKQKDKVT